ncbi:C6 transcription factor protein [Rutstroemia sp. NJR-2017a BBW]|nr:C6 transcription factor protein [Rutstroemia sp. NJR-2017a BBW]
MDENPRPSKRARKSCERCRTRKQRCKGFPVCENCQSAKEECIQPQSAIEEYRSCSGPNAALLERISFLEAQLAAYTNVPPPEHNGFQTYRENGHAASPTTSDDERRGSNLADIVGFITLGGEASYVGSSSGFALATTLDHISQATVRPTMRWGGGFSMLTSPGFICGILFSIGWISYNGMPTDSYRRTVLLKTNMGYSKYI